MRWGAAHEQSWPHWASPWASSLAVAADVRPRRRHRAPSTTTPSPSRRSTSPRAGCWPSSTRQALEARGLQVRRAIGIGPRELVGPALALGLVELVPEYAGTALGFLSLGRAGATADAAATHQALEQAAADRHLTALASAPAQNANTFVVTRETAEREHLQQLSDLAAVAPELTFGGPPECPTRPLCLEGLEQRYGVHFGHVLALDAGGPTTRQALEQGAIDVGLLFTTDPALATGDLVALEDDQGLQPAENVTPLVRTEVVDRWGERGHGHPRRAVGPADDRRAPPARRRRGQRVTGRGRPRLAPRGRLGVTTGERTAEGAEPSEAAAAAGFDRADHGPPQWSPPPAVRRGTSPAPQPRLDRQGAARRPRRAAGLGHRRRGVACRTPGHRPPRRPLPPPHRPPAHAVADDGVPGRRPGRPRMAGDGRLAAVDRRPDRPAAMASPLHVPGQRARPGAGRGSP